MAQFWITGGPRCDRQRVNWRSLTQWAEGHRDIVFEGTEANCFLIMNASWKESTDFLEWRRLPQGI